MQKEISVKVSKPKLLISYGGFDSKIISFFVKIAKKKRSFI
jgi:hypothetical protein